MCAGAVQGLYKACAGKLGSASWLKDVGLGKLARSGPFHVA